MKTVLFAVLAVSSFGCATFTNLSPDTAQTDLSRGVWVTKSSSLFGIMTSSQEVLFCRATETKPVCVAAGGDVEPAKTGGK